MFFLYKSFRTGSVVTQGSGYNVAARSVMWDTEFAAEVKKRAEKRLDNIVSTLGFGSFLHNHQWADPSV
ncbi:TPA: hypothetical protein DIT45_00565 [Candidatus Acetothermia bacterium]|nr:hypothetical protein [Candidatus Acetothermia bacterium]